MTGFNKFMTISLIAIIYLSFISLGLPDSLLGSAWPSMYQSFDSTISAAGTVFMIIAGGTVISSLNADRLIHRFGTPKVTITSVLTTAVSLFGFSLCTKYWHLCLMAVPYGLGAGAIDSALNNYVALHFKARHMSWLHCMWGVGASIGPYVMGLCLTHHLGWQNGYRIIGVFQLLLTMALFSTLSLWKKEEKEEKEEERNVLSLGKAFSLPGVLQVMCCFLSYSALEQTTGLWAASWMNVVKGISAEQAAFYASMFYLGITIGRGLSGFITEKLGDSSMIRLGSLAITIGIALLIFGKWEPLIFAGLVIIGLGCAPVYPSIIHATPRRFGRENSQSLVGMQMASAYIGTTFMPKLFGVLSDIVGISSYPFYLIVFLLLMIFMHEWAEKITR